MDTKRRILKLTLIVLAGLVYNPLLDARPSTPGGIAPGGLTPPTAVKTLFIETTAKVLNVSKRKISKSKISGRRVNANPLQYEMITSYAPGDLAKGFYSCIALYTIKNGDIYTNRYQCGWNSPSGVEVGNW